MKLRAALAAGVAAWLLSAPPVAHAAAAPAASLRLTMPSAGPRPIAFAQLSLDDAETFALANSPDVGAARAVVGESAASLAAAQGAIGPALVANYNEAPQGGASGQTIAQRLTTIGLQTTLGDLTAYGSLVGSARASLRAARASLAAAERAERVKVIGLYFDALRGRAIALARAEAVQTALAQRRAAELRAAAGDAPRLDVVRASVALARALAAAATASATDENAVAALRVETLPSASFGATVDRPLPPPLALSAGEASVRAAQRRGDLRAAADATAAARGAAAASRLQALPTVTVTGGYTSGVDSGVAVHGPSLAVSLNLPLGGVGLAQARQREAVVLETLAKQRALERQVTLDVAASARNLAAAQVATLATTQARDQARDELTSTELGYRNGASSSLEVAAARDLYTQAVVDELTSVYDELKARAILELETGP